MLGSSIVVETSNRKILFIRLQFYTGPTYESEIDFHSVMGNDSLLALRND